MDGGLAGAGLAGLEKREGGVAHGAVATAGSVDVDTVRAGTQALVERPAAASFRLAAPPVPLVATLGDSRIAGDMRSAHGTLFARTARGPVTWANALLGQRFSIDFDSHAAVNGATTAQILQQVPKVIASGAGIAIYLGHCNDPKSEHVPAISAEDSIANITAAIDQLTAAGILVVFIADLPREDRNWKVISKARVADIRRRVAYVNRRIIEYARRKPGLFVVDARPAFQHPATAEPLPHMTYDGTHLAPLGAYTVGVALARTLDRLLPAPLPTSYLAHGDSYDALTNPLGNMLANPMLAFRNHAPTPPVAGIRPEGWTCTRSRNGTLRSGTLTVGGEAAPDGNGFRAVVAASSAVLDPPNAADVVSIGQAVALPDGIKAGDVLEGQTHVLVEAGATGLRSASLQVIEANGSGTTVQYEALEAMDGPAYWPPTAVELVLRTPRITIRPEGGAGPRRLSFNLTIRTDSTAPMSFTVRFWNPSLRRRP